ncbi:MAG: FMN-binding protein [Rudaea sp.]
MPRNQTRKGSPVVRALKKAFVSSFVAFTFVAYALHERTAPESAAAPATSAPSAQVVSPTDPPQPTFPALAPTSGAAAPPQPTPTTVVVKNGLKDGDYTGQSVDAFYGTVQVQAVIQNGKLAEVKFLQYPNDRRTSVRINNFAIPVLTQEAVQAQNANVDIITGATLTSEAFAESLQTALDSAKVSA